MPASAKTKTTLPCANTRPTIALTVAIGLLVLGGALGFSNIGLNVQTMHRVLAVLICLLVPPILYIHGKRFWTHGPSDHVAWFHFITLAVLLFIVVHMIRRWWLPSHTHNHAPHDDDELPDNESFHNHAKSTTTAQPTSNRIDVYAPNDNEYVIDGQSNPTLSMTVGNTYTIYVHNHPRHPFEILKNGQSLATTTKEKKVISWTPLTAGVYTYRCTSHPQMKGTIHVTA